MTRALVVASLALLAGCAPLTFSNEEAIDFDRYRSVYVRVGGLDGSERDALYLERELRDASGFSLVTRDPDLSVDVRLDVELEIELDRDLFSDDPDEYAGRVRYVLTSRELEPIDSGEASSSGNSDAFAAAEAALDEVVSRYLPSYRL